MLSYATLKAARTALIAYESDLRYSVHLLQRIDRSRDQLDTALATTSAAIAEIENVLLEVHADA